MAIGGCTLVTWSALGRFPWEIGVTFALVTSSVHAEPVTDEGGNVHLGVRAGYGIPFGMIREAGSATLPGGAGRTSWKDTKLSDPYSGMVPIWLDAGYFVTKAIMVGLYGHYGIGLVKEATAASDFGCFPGSECSGSVIRVGIQGQYHLARGKVLDPLAGARRRV